MTLPQTNQPGSPAGKPERRIVHRAMLTPELVRRIIRMENGKLFWLHRNDDLFATSRHRDAWNRQYAGHLVGTKVASCGYRVLRIHRVDVLEHRLVWMLHHGDWPKLQIDHINGDPLDNRIDNLRDVSASLNQRNAALQKTNTSGCSGVSFDRRDQRWSVRIYCDGKAKRYGGYATKEEAIAVRLAANKALGFTERHGIAHHLRPSLEAAA